MSLSNKITVTLSVDYLSIVNTATNPVNVESYGADDIISVDQNYHDFTALNTYQPGTKEFDEIFEVVIRIKDVPTLLKFDIQNVTNQAGWTLNQAGLTQAVDDIKAFSASGGAGDASAANQATQIANQVTAIAHLADIEAAVEGSGSAALANVTSSITSITLQAANTSRKELVVFNDSSEILLVKYGATASATSFTYRVQSGDHLIIDGAKYNGVVDGIWLVANGFARVTEAG